MSSSSREDVRTTTARRRVRSLARICLLSRISRAPVEVGDVDLSQIATASAAEFKLAATARDVRVEIAPSLKTRGDPRLLRLVFDNLLDNAFKFTAGRSPAHIEIGETLEDGRQAFFVRDNGAGFDGRYVHKLFGAFQRLHDVRDYPGTGIGLATVQRIVSRHGGRVWAQGEPDRGATFTFTLSGEGTTARPPVPPERAAQTGDARRETRHALLDHYR